MKIHIASSTDLGQRCSDWVNSSTIWETNHGVELTDNMEECDIFISVFYNKLITEEFIDSKHFCFNFHGGILPYNRGSATPNWAILNGEKEFGVTLHEIDKGIDTGPIIAVRKWTLNGDETGESLSKRAADEVFELFKEWFGRLITWDYVSHPQEPKDGKTYTRKMFQDAKDLTKYARAYHFPGYEQAFWYNSKGEKKYLDW